MKTTVLSQRKTRESPEKCTLPAVLTTGHKNSENLITKRKQNGRKNLSLGT